VRGCDGPKFVHMTRRKNRQERGAHAIADRSSHASRHHVLAEEALITTFRKATAGSASPTAANEGLERLPSDAGVQSFTNPMGSGGDPGEDERLAAREGGGFHFLACTVCVAGLTTDGGSAHRDNAADYHRTYDTEQSLSDSLNTASDIPYLGSVLQITFRHRFKPQTSWALVTFDHPAAAHEACKAEVYSRVPVATLGGLQQHASPRGAKRKAYRAGGEPIGARLTVQHLQTEELQSRSGSGGTLHKMLGIAQGKAAAERRARALARELQEQSCMGAAVDRAYHAVTSVLCTS
jgi:hypothetical protein